MVNDTGSLYPLILIDIRKIFVNVSGINVLLIGISTMVDSYDLTILIRNYLQLNWSNDFIGDIKILTCNKLDVQEYVVISNLI